MSLQTLIDENRRAIDSEPVKARAVFRVTGDLVGLTEVDLHARDHAVKVDEPATLGGQDLAANPVEYALISLASCQAITYRFWAAKLGIELEGLEVTAEGDLDVRGFFGFDESVRPGFTAVRLEITPSGPESAERYQELAEAVDAHCPVLDLFTNTTPVHRKIAVAA
jgi:putative redox protein